MEEYNSTLHSATGCPDVDDRPMSPGSHNIYAQPDIPEIIVKY